VALQVLQELDDLRRLDGPREKLEVEVPPGDPSHHRQGLPAEVVLQHWRLAARCPSTIAVRALTQSAFIDEDDGLSLSGGVCFSSGQRTRCHRRMAVSSRSNFRSRI
jgi:hypothetical protein